MVTLLSSKLPWELMNPRLAAAVNPLLSNPLVNGLFLDGVVLAVGDNVINHLLGRKLQGYEIVLRSAAIAFYDKQAANQHTDLTLVLHSDVAATVTIYVF